jgi:hypothetical protein
MGQGWHRKSRRIYIFSSEREMRIIIQVWGSLCIGESYQQLRGSSLLLIGRRWCDTFNLNVHDTTKDKTDDVKYSFYENYNMYSLNSLNTI